MCILNPDPFDDDADEPLYLSTDKEVINGTKTAIKKCNPPSMRHNNNKPKLSNLLMFPLAIGGLSARVEFGDAKYPRYNWKRGFPYTELIDSALRHLVAFQNGETPDPEHPLTDHLDAALWNILVLSDQVKSKRGEDDRYENIK